MKFITNSKSKRKANKGFSLVEVAIAMGVVTLLLTTFLGVFGPAQKNIQRALSTKDANRMKDTLSNEMSILRPTEYAATTSTTTNVYSSSFDKAFYMISGSHDGSDDPPAAVLIYQYKAVPVDDDDDGILPPFTTDTSGVSQTNIDEGVQGRNYIVQTAVRVVGKDDDRIEDELHPDAVVGSVFVVRMSQLVKSSSSTATKLILEANSTGTIVNPETGDAVAGPDAYPKAVIAFKAEFFRLKSNNYQYISSGSWNFETIGNAVTEVNMAIRR
jgi:type II secretory pathway pseudopilin PulG